MKERPKILCKDLAPELKIVVLKLVREFSKPIVHHLGIDQTEEAMVELLDTGELKILFDDENEIFTLGYWDEEEQDYIEF